MHLLTIPTLLMETETNPFHGWCSVTLERYIWVIMSWKWCPILSTKGLVRVGGMGGGRQLIILFHSLLPSLTCSRGCSYFLCGYESRKQANGPWTRAGIEKSSIFFYMRQNFANLLQSLISMQVVNIWVLVIHLLWCIRDLWFCRLEASLIIFRIFIPYFFS